MVLDTGTGSRYWIVVLDTDTDTGYWIIFSLQHHFMSDVAASISAADLQQSSSSPQSTTTGNPVVVLCSTTSNTTGNPVVVLQLLLPTVKQTEGENKYSAVSSTVQRIWSIIEQSMLTRHRGGSCDNECVRFCLCVCLRDTEGSSDPQLQS